MRAFLHDRARRLLTLLDEADGALDACRTLRPDAPDAVDALLGRAADEYRSLGLPVADNELRALRAQLGAARRGVHPLTLERAATRRGELERATALHVLLRAAERLRSDVTAGQESLDAAVSELQPLVAWALQAGVVPSVPGSPDARAEAVWRAVVADATTRPLAQGLLLVLSRVDVLLLLGDLLAGLPDDDGVPHGAVARER